jgi:hypothetical protein
MRMNNRNKSLTFIVLLIGLVILIIVPSNLKVFIIWPGLLEVGSCGEACCCPEKEHYICACIFKK